MRRSTNQSRLTRRVEQQTKRNIIITVLVMIVVLFFLIKIGLPLFANIALFISGTKASNSTDKKVSIFIPPPVLNSLPTATNSAQITISGTATAKQKVDLYVNDEIVDKTEAKDDNTFTFENITLSPKQNSIKAKMVDKNDKESEFSNELTVEFKSSSPTLTIDSPSDGQEFKKDDNTTTIMGKTDPGIKVYINDLWAIVDENGNFSYNLPLRDGDNEIKIYAIDQAGNKTEKSLKVKYNP